MYGYGKQGGIFLSDKDYSYDSNIVKIQLFYNIKKGNLSFDLIIEPTVGFAKHQLLNFYFIEPNQINYLEKRAEFTKSKLITEYILINQFVMHKKISGSFNIYTFIGVGSMYISKRTERLAKGFAFAENIGLGFSVKIAKNIYFDLRGRLRHLSNAELQKPNSGINIASLETGLSFNL
jgi:hypothetical protein